MRVANISHNVYRASRIRPNLAALSIETNYFNPNRPYENLSSISWLAPAAWIARNIFTTAWIARATRQDGIGEGLTMSFIWNFAPGMVIDVLLYPLTLLSQRLKGEYVEFVDN